MLRVLTPESAFLYSIDNIDGRSKARFEACTSVCRIWHPVASDDIVHAWLWRLGRHVEPQSCRNCKPAFVGDTLGFVKQSLIISENYL